jgi:hypothetical protein
VVVLQNCIELWSGELGLCATSSGFGIEVIHVQVEVVTEVTGGEDHEPRTDPGVGVMCVWSV